MKVVKLEIDSSEWFSFVDSCPNAMAFHHPAWAQLLTKCYGYRAFALALTDDAGQIVAGMPIVEVRKPLGGRRWVSLPFTDVCLPINNSSFRIDGLMDYLVTQLCQRKIEMIDIHGLIPNQNSRIIHHNNAYLWHKIALINDSTALFRTFDKTRVREPIRQAQRRGVKIRWCDKRSEIMIFYYLLLDTRRRLGSPVQPKRFFQMFWEDIIEKGLGFVLLAYYENKPIGGGVFLRYKNTLIAKYNASDSKYWKLRVNNALYWAAIQWGCENGYKWFDWGRTELDNEKLRDFKKGWGSQEESLVYSVIAQSAPRISHGYTKKILNYSIRHSPPLLCRLIGEIFYKYAA